ncbi:MAG: GNAT family N-acetyltransferase [Methylocystis sp.]
MTTAQPNAARRRIGPRAPADTPALVELWLAAWRATYAEIDFDARSEWFVGHLAALEAGGAITLCLRDDAPSRLAGFVVINPSTGWLDQLCVHPDRFGGGAASALIDAARQASPRGIRLDVNADNFRARRFYEREGFCFIGPGTISRSGRETVVLEWRPVLAAVGK